MSMQFIIPPFLRHLTGGSALVNVNGNNVGDCLTDLIRQFPILQEEVLDENGELREYIEIYINGRTTYPEDLAKTVSEGDEILILNVIAGG
jgi:sulfur-carrier protein